MDQSSTSSSVDKTTLLRFLHYARSGRLYQPGNPHRSRVFQPETAKSFKELLSNSEGQELVNMVARVYESGLSVHPDAFVFILATFIRYGNKFIQESAFKMASQMLKTPEDLFLFVKFIEHLSSPKTGWGRGVKKVVASWYGKRDPMQLAADVIRCRGRHGWRHRDLIKLSHFKTDNKAIQVIVKYILFGLESAKQQYENESEAEEVLGYITKLEDFKKSNDHKVAARLVEQLHLNIDHVPTSMLKSPEIWKALIMEMHVIEVLEALPRLTLAHLLKADAPLVTTITDYLSTLDEEKLAEIHPVQVYLALRNYECAGRPPIRAQANTTTKQVVRKKQVKNPPRTNQKIITALNKLIGDTIKTIRPTGKRYLIAVDVRNPMVHGTCIGCPQVSPAHAATLLTLSLVAVEQDVKVVAFGMKTVSEVNIPKDATLAEAMKKFRETPMGNVNIKQPIEYATEKKLGVDVFLLLTDSQITYQGKHPTLTLKEYRQKTGNEGTRLITCCLAKKSFRIAGLEDPLMLDVAGFDCNLPNVISAFANGAF